MQYTTKSLQIKPISRADAQACIDLLTNTEVCKTYMLPVFTSREAAQPLFERLVELSLDPDCYVAGIYLGGSFIGLINETQRADTTIELGYALLPAYHNKGYATQALTGAITYLHSSGFHTITAGAFTENPASIRVMQKAGMTAMDKTEEIEYRGTVHTCVYYSHTTIPRKHHITSGKERFIYEP